MQDCFVYECKNSMLNIHNSDNTIYSHHINNSICFIDILENCSNFINQLNNMNYNILYEHSTESDFFANIKIDNKDIYKNYLKNFFISEKKIYASEFFSVYHIIIVKNFGIEKNVLEIPLFNNYLFKILSYKGFLLTNLTLFLDKAKYINNLLVSFTETELADELLKMEK